MITATNPIESSARAAAEACRINVETLSKFAGITLESLSEYVSLNDQCLREMMRDPSRAAGDYLQGVYRITRQDLELRADALRDAVALTSELWMPTRSRNVPTEMPVPVDEATMDEVVPAPPPRNADNNLERIRGIGESTAEQLRAAGVETIEQVAGLDLEQLDEEHPLHPLRGRIEADQWIQKAQDLLDEDL